MGRNNPNRTVTLCFRFLGTVLKMPLKLRDLSGVELLQTLTFPLLPSPGALSSHRSSLSYLRIPNTHLLHPYSHFNHPHLTSLGALPLVIGFPNNPAAISFSNNGMSLVPVPAKISGAEESYEKLIGGYLISCSPFLFNMEFDNRGAWLECQEQSRIIKMKYETLSFV